MPVYSTIFIIVTFSSIGLPGLNGFIGEFLILLGAFKFSWPLALLASTGVIFGALYMLYVYEKIFLGPVTNEKNNALSDMTFSERASLVPLLFFIFLIGIYPSFITAKIDASVKNISKNVLRNYDTDHHKPSLTIDFNDKRSSSAKTAVFRLKIFK